MTISVIIVEMGRLNLLTVALLLNVLLMVLMYYIIYGSDGCKALSNVELGNRLIVLRKLVLLCNGFMYLNIHMICGALVN